AAALVALESEGFAMRGRFTPGAATEEWCERRLLARIHHYTVKRLRAEIEPVSARDFVRFLFVWQHAGIEERMRGPKAVEPIVEQLEGFEAAAAAWETELLPARISGYEPAWLDEKCLSGHVTWARLSPGAVRPENTRPRVGPVRTTPIALLSRRHARYWMSLAANTDEVQPSAAALSVAECIRRHGASFFDEIVDETGLLKTHVQEALAELVGLGLVNSDSFGGLRALLAPSGEGNSRAAARRLKAKAAIDAAGRWSLARHAASKTPDAQAKAAAIEHVARTLLKRYGVVFWRVLAREAPWLPPWRDLLRVYRKLEGRGEIR